MYVLEVNPRASRADLSKVTGVPMVAAAAHHALRNAFRHGNGARPAPGKQAGRSRRQCSRSQADHRGHIPGSEMKSTGELMGTDTTFLAALKRAFVASGVRPPRRIGPYCSPSPTATRRSWASRGGLVMGFDSRHRRHIRRDYGKRHQLPAHRTTTWCARSRNAKYPWSSTRPRAAS